MKYKLLGKSGLRVSELCLGTMTFGEEWGYGADEKESKKIFTSFTEAGGNFYDTANRYTEGTSEKHLGKFIKEFGNRNEAVIATKYSLYTEQNKINDSGNHRKNLVQSVEGSLKRLGTDYIDLLYIHAWDGTTDVEEVMRSLEYLVQSGKVLHIGISDTPAWIIAKANTLSEFRGWSSFIGVQLEYSLIRRDAERELIPMCREYNLGITAWAPLGAGLLTGKYNKKNFENQRLSENSLNVTEKNMAIALKLSDIAKQKDIPEHSMALNWMRQKHLNLIPVVGARKNEQIVSNLKCLEQTLDADTIAQLDEISQIELGFPHDFLTRESVENVMYGGLKEKIT